MLGATASAAQPARPGAPAGGGSLPSAERDGRGRCRQGAVQSGAEVAAERGTASGGSSLALPPPLAVQLLLNLATGWPVPSVVAMRIAYGQDAPARFLRSVSFSS